MNFRNVLLSLRPFAILIISAAAVAVASRVYANSYNSISSNSWTNTATWDNGGGPPTGTDDVTIQAPHVVTMNEATAPQANSIGINGTLQLQQDFHTGYMGINGVLDLADKSATVDGFVDFSGVGATVNRTTGKLTAGGITVSGGANFNFGADDVVGDLNVWSGASATTAGTGNVTNSISTETGTNLTLGASAAVNYLGVQGTLNMADKDVVINTFFDFSGAGAAINRTTGKITAVGGITASAGANFNFGADDVAGDLNVWSGASATTVSTSNVTGSISTEPGTTLTLGAHAVVNYAGISGLLSMGDKNLSVNTNMDISGSVTRTTGTLTVPGGIFIAAGTTFTTAAGDAIHDLTAFQSSTAALGANTTLSGSASIQENSSLVLGGWSLTANSVSLGPGTATATSGSMIVSNDLHMFGNGNLLQVTIGPGQTTGLTLKGLTTDNSFGLTLEGNSQIQLLFDDAVGPGMVWGLAWYGDHVSPLQTLYSNGGLLVDAPPSISFDPNTNIFLDGGITYVGFTIQAETEGVPEPSTLALAALGLAGLGFVVWRRRK